MNAWIATCKQWAFVIMMSWYQPDRALDNFLDQLSEEQLGEFSRGSETMSADL